mmetsp:Transcript_10475/g.25616  ORF Transcript_10475/g.25616 Transcript_10475/m.25616 type:complete len:210 (+) Transcript_10475:506-1135(+)
MRPVIFLDVLFDVLHLVVQVRRRDVVFALPPFHVPHLKAASHHRPAPGHHGGDLSRAERQPNCRVDGHRVAPASLAALAGEVSAGGRRRDGGQAESTANDPAQTAATSATATAAPTATAAAAAPGPPRGRAIMRAPRLRRRSFSLGDVPLASVLHTAPGSSSKATPGWAAELAGARAVSRAPQVSTGSTVSSAGSSPRGGAGARAVAAF